MTKSLRDAQAGVFLALTMGTACTPSSRGARASRIRSYPSLGARACPSEGSVRPPSQAPVPRGTLPLMRSGNRLSSPLLIAVGLE